MNVFEDCGSTKCVAIWYQLGAKAFDPNIIIYDAYKYANMRVYTGIHTATASSERVLPLSNSLL